ncbi:hypothetical protein [Actinorugispora endophytica]|uniref:LemA protein n=1 Tax=Actinorugispora endophytica TaxID=1605990 RepID=A0A4R6UWP2_9ACTN|nr:hypothetical protein [Actinorugispora endophytica]TDQ51611.1 hypothetical protein EV190_110100 [Actinorugispora endophytica]
MDALTAVGAVLALLVLFSFYLSWRATRLDRLHTRLETANAALDAALARRGAVVAELAAAGVLGPAAGVILSDAAARARRAEARADRELAESSLSRALRAVLAEAGDPPEESADLLAETRAAAKRVYIARRFYNDAVSAIHTARSSRLVGVLRLAGKAGMPDYFEMDDEPPEQPGRV